MQVLEDIEEECTDELRGCCEQLLATNCGGSIESLRAIY